MKTQAQPTYSRTLPWAMLGRPLRLVAVFLVGAACAYAAEAGVHPSSVVVEVPTFQFDTANLFGEIRAPGPVYRDLPKPGVVLCRHKPSGTDVVPEVPFHALLMPEWLLRPGRPREGIFWGPLNAKADVAVEADSVVFRIPRAATGSWEFDAVFRYSPGPDWIDFSCTLEPGVSIPDFEFLFASYIDSRFDETWMPVSTADGEVWRTLDRGDLKHGYQIAGDAESHTFLTDGRWADTPEIERGIIDRPDWFFARPILIALERSTGLAVVTLVEPARCTMLPMQHHAVETAHDFTIGGDLEAGKTYLARARVVIRNVGEFPDTTDAVEAMWQHFLGSLDGG